MTLGLCFVGLQSGEWPRKERKVKAFFRHQESQMGSMGWANVPLVLKEISGGKDAKLGP